MLLGIMQDLPVRSPSLLEKYEANDYADKGAGWAEVLPDGCQGKLYLGVQIPTSLLSHFSFISSVFLLCFDEPS